jgi:hypothetical protein
MLIPKRASKSRPSGEWSDDDYDVFDGDQHIIRVRRHTPGLFNRRVKFKVKSGIRRPTAC